MSPKPNRQWIPNSGQKEDLHTSCRLRPPGIIQLVECKGKNLIKVGWWVLLFHSITYCCNKLGETLLLRVKGTFHFHNAFCVFLSALTCFIIISHAVEYYTIINLLVYLSSYLRVSILEAKRILKILKNKNITNFLTNINCYAK